MEAQQINYGRKWYVFAAVATGILLTTIDGTIVNVALPTLVRDLDTDFATVQWVVLAYLLTLATLMLSMGRLGDMIGKKPIYATGFIIFTAGSALCGLAPTVYWLIGFRIIQAIGGSMTLALGIAIITEAFPPHERGKALGTSGAFVSLGIVLGPTLGGLIIDAFSWNWVFYVNVPVGIVGSLMVARFIPRFKPVGRQQFDYLGAGALFVSLLCLLLALTVGQQTGFAEPPILALFAGWLLFLALFITIERRSPHPMVDLRLFRNTLFSINLVTGLTTFIAIAGSFILMPFYLENVLGYGTRDVGLLLAAVPIVLAVFSPLSGTLSDRYGTRPISIIGLAIILTGYYAMSTLSAETSAAGFILRWLPVGIGMGVFQSPNNSAIMGAAPRERLGIASGLLSITRSLGQTIGIAVLGAFWASRVLNYSAAAVTGGATTATAAAQISGLRDTFLANVALLAIGLSLSVWGFVKERRS